VTQCSDDWCSKITLMLTAQYKPRSSRKRITFMDSLCKFNNNNGILRTLYNAGLTVLFERLAGVCLWQACSLHCSLYFTIVRVYKLYSVCLFVRLSVCLSMSLTVYLIVTFTWRNKSCYIISRPIV